MKTITRLMIRTLIPRKKIQGQEDSYLEMTFYLIKCNDRKKHFSDVWG